MISDIIHRFCCRPILTTLSSIYVHITLNRYSNDIVLRWYNNIIANNNINNDFVCFILKILLYMYKYIHRNFTSKALLFSICYPMFSRWLGMLVYFKRMYYMMCIWCYWKYCYVRLLTKNSLKIDRIRVTV